jgi:hypothetical protein
MRVACNNRENMPREQKCGERWTTVCIPIIDGTEGVKALLPRSVPDGEIDGGSIDVQALAQERRCATR